VQGDVKLRYESLDDLVLLRADNTPTYMLAVVVDDHDMGITHVIRGDDHLTNTFRQIPIYHGMAWDVPVFAHVPMIHGPDGKKLSKRHGALGVEAYRDLGYLPEGLKNYLLRLGWSHGDAEIISEAQAIEWFDLPGLNKSPARLDIAKLDSVNAHYMTQAHDDRLFALYSRRPEAQGLSDAALGRIREGMSVLKARSANLAVLAKQARFLTDLRPIVLSGKTAALMNHEAKARLVAISSRLEALQDWREPEIREEIARYCVDAGVSLGKVGPILRAALTGGAPSPDISVVLALLGRNESCLLYTSPSPRDRG
jgi:glutamyl-tRNA synthetase